MWAGDMEPTASMMEGLWCWEGQLGRPRWESAEGLGALVWVEGLGYASALRAAGRCSPG